MTLPKLTEKEFYSRMGKASAKKHPRSKKFYQDAQKRSVAKRKENQRKLSTGDDIAHSE